MARRGLSEERRAAQALQASRRLIARGQRPLYRLVKADDGRFAIEGATWLSIASTSRREATAEARALIAESIDVSPDSFDNGTGG